MAASFSIAHVSPYPWEARGERGQRPRRARRRASSRGAGTACWCSRRRARRSGCGASRETLRAAAGRGRRACSRAPTEGTPRVLAVGEVLDVVSRAPGRRPPALPIDVARTIEELLGDGRARLRPRARAVRPEHVQRRAAPLARAQRRLLPLLQRAAALDARGAALRGELLRPSRRPHREPARDGRADGAPLPRRVPARARRRRRRRRARGALRGARRPPPRTRRRRRRSTRAVADGR